MPCTYVCLPAWTGLQGAEAFYCEKCKDKTAATKQLRLHRFPEVLVLHIKRFKYKVSCCVVVYMYRITNCP